MSAVAVMQANNAAQRNMSSYTVTSLKRWSSQDNALPSIDQIKHLHVYDFDNTLFCSPLPNKQLWKGEFIGLLQTQDTFANGGWWHDSNILASTGDGVEKEEARAWEGWWNEQIVNLVELSMLQKDALTILLTGRSEGGFAELVKRMVKSKRLQFDLVCLKPEVGPANQKFASTMKFKQAFLDELVNTYRNADEIRIYEDRPKHVNAFKDYLASLNNSISSRAIHSPSPRQKQILGEVIEVSDVVKNLDPVQEVAEVQRMINSHNQAYRAGKTGTKAKPWMLKRTVIFTGYLISPKDTIELLKATNLPTNSTSDGDLRTLANNIMITGRPGPAPKSVVDKAGGIGHAVRWKIVATGVHDGKVWAARVQPVPQNTAIYTETSNPSVVLALRRNARPFDASRITQWTPLPPDRQYEFDTAVGEKVLLRIEEERAEAPLQGQNKQPNKRPRPTEEDFPALGAPTGPKNDDNRRTSNGAWNGNNRGGAQRSGRGNGGGGGGGGGQRGGGRNGRGSSGKGGGRGRGRGHGYHSLDDIGPSSGRNVGYDGADDGGLTY